MVKNSGFEGLKEDGVSRTPGKSRANFLATGMKALNNVADIFSQQTLNMWADNEEFMEELFLANLTSPMNVNQICPLSIPADGVEFELTLKSFNSAKMAIASGFAKPHLWKFIGREISLPQTRCFKLIRGIYVNPLIDCGSNNFHKTTLDIIRDGLAIHGSIPEGQWIWAFMERFQPDPRDCDIGIADFCWLGPEEKQFYFPFLSGRSYDKKWNFTLKAGGGKPIGDNEDMLDPGDWMMPDWRWLVEVTKKNLQE